MPRAPNVSVQRGTHAPVAAPPPTPIPATAAVTPATAVSAGAPPLETSPPADDTESSPAHRRNGRCARIPHRRWRAPVRRGAAARNAPSVFFTAFLLFFFAPSNIFMMDCTCVAPHAQPHRNKNTSRRIDCTTAAWGTACKDRQTKNPRMEASDIGTSNTGNAASGPRIDRGLPCAMQRKQPGDDARAPSRSEQNPKRTVQPPPKSTLHYYYVHPHLLLGLSPPPAQEAPLVRS